MLFQRKENKSDPDAVRRHIIFHGDVQGVGFRYHAVYKARLLGLTGWVRNLYDGTVEMEVQGYDALIDRLILYLHDCQWIRITDMDVREIPTVEERDFSECW